MRAELMKADEGGLTDDVKAVTKPGVVRALAQRIVGTSQLPSWLRAGAPTWIWLGVLLCVAGFALIAVAWSQVAAETQVHLQIPYVVSAGLTSLALIMSGLLILNVVSRRRDAIDRSRQTEELVAILEELNKKSPERKQRR